jgi:hypothetical protein
MAKNNLSNQAMIIIIVLTFILIGGGIYFYNYIQEREAFLTKRNIRLLTRLGNQINSTIEGFHELINNEVQNLEKSDKLDTLKLRIMNLMNLDSDLDSCSIQREQGVKFKKISSLSFREFKSKIAFVDNELNYSSGINKGDSVSYSVVLNVSSRIKKFIDDLSSEKIFDEIFFTETTTGKIVQNTDAKFTISNFDSLWNNDKQKVRAQVLINADSEGSFKVAGDEYKIFIHPLSAFNCSNTNNGNQKWAVCGVVSKINFRTESFKISSNKIILFGCMILFVILSWPILKLKYSTRGTRIGIYDVIFTFLAAAFATAFIVIGLMDFFTYQKLHNDMDNQLKEYSNLISNHFKEEVKRVQYQLRNYDNNKKQYYDFANTTNKLFNKSSAKPNTYPFFEQVFWCDLAGDQKAKYSTGLNVTKLNNTKTRDYFKNVLEDKLWIVNQGAEPCAMQPLISKSTGDFSVSLSMKSKAGDDIFAVVMDFIPLSLAGIVAPHGFSFAVINNSGLVLFHSQPERNLQENLFTELGNSNLLKAVVSTHTEEFFETDYWGKSNRFYIMPIKGIPWYLVTFCDKSYIQSNNLEIVSLALLQFFVYMLPFVFVFFYYILAPEGKGSWVWPKLEKKEALSKLILCYSLIIVVQLFIVLLSSDEATLLFSAFMISHVTLIVTYLSLNPAFSSNRFDRLLGKYKENKPIFAILVDLALLSIIYSAIIKQFLWPVAIGVIISFVIFILLQNPNYIKKILPGKLLPGKNRRHGQLQNSEKEKKERINFKKLYVLGILTLFVVGIIMPALSFFKIGYISQMKLFIKDKQLQLANDIELRKENIYKHYNERKAYSGFKQFRQIRLSDTLDVYSRFLYNTKIEKNINYSFVQSLKPAWFDTVVVKNLIPSYNPITIKQKQLASNPKDRTAGFIVNDSDDKLILIQNAPLSGIKHSNDRDNYATVITSDLPGLVSIMLPFNLLKFVLFVFTIIIFCLLLYKLILFVNEKIFLLSQIEPLTSKNSSSIYNYEKITQNTIIFTKNGKLEQRIGGEYPTFSFYDKIFDREISDTFSKDKDNELIVLENFEAYFDDKSENDKKLPLMEKLIYSTQMIVVLVSSVDPNNGFVIDKEKSEKWSQLLNYFDRKWIVDKEINAYCEQMKTNNEFKLNKSISNYLWDTSSKEEKDVIIRLSKDKFLSPILHPTLANLLERGIVKRIKGFCICLDLENIESSQKVDNVEPWDKEEADSLRTKVKIPLITAVFFIVVFLFVTQPDLYNNTSAFVTAIAALIPAIFKIIGVFKDGKVA